MQNNLSIPYRPKFLANQVIVVDGLVGGGKGLMSNIVSAIPRVEMWLHRAKFEQVCGLWALGHLSFEGATAMVRTWVDQETDNLAMVRDINFRPQDFSSFLRDARPWRYFKRLLRSGGAEALKRAEKEKIVLNFMTHSISGHCEPLFEALGRRLVYIRFNRSPMTEYVLNHVARWTDRWGCDARGGMLLHYNKSDKSRFLVPFYMQGKESVYLNANPLEKAILLLENWQIQGDKVMDKLTKNDDYTIIEIPYEKFVFEPKTYIDKISTAIGTEIDRITLREMKKQGVPRRSLTDAPKNKTYSRLGWKKPDIHRNVLDEFSFTKEKISSKISSEMMSKLENLTNDYIKRYDIK